MAMWLVSAIRMLSGLARGRTGALGLGLALPDPFDVFGGDDDKPKRRRRRRALTQSDRNDIAFIAATISKVAAGSFAVQLATRSR